MKSETLQMLDITGPVHVEIAVRPDKRVIWINVDGVCRLRICGIPQGMLHIDEDSPLTFSR